MEEPNFKLLKFFVVAMGLALVVATCALIGKLVMKASSSAQEVVEKAEVKRLPITGCKSAELSIPANAEPVDFAVENGRGYALVRVKDEAGAVRYRVIAAQSCTP